ncbi:peptidase S8/S53 domain-containing protein [Geranomyces variabilis]|nr:peptidase S8/S53 domain-containing protein [Geranomyces variabilis]KAJ3139807.1 pheromone processing endoprotease [Geranomyces variabilis]
MPASLWARVFVSVLAAAHASALRPAAATATAAAPRHGDHENYHYLAVRLEPSTDAAESDNLEARAQALASGLSYHFLGRVGELPNYFLLAAEKQPPVARRDAPLTPRSREHAVELQRREHVNTLAGAEGVAWVEAQVPKVRLFKRAPTPAAAEEDTRGRPFRLDEIVESLQIKDPGFPRQWHLVNTITIGNDLNVTGVWKQGITGHGSTVCFVDDGLDWHSKDLAANYYNEGSYDFNNHVQDPRPKVAEDHHGTRCAGEVAAVRNDVCGVGVAYDAKVSGVRILGGPLTEADEAAAINFDFHNNHIFSCSWGPADDGRSMEAPPEIVTDAVLNGINNGRNGKGSIFVFASGNGAASSDHCNADGYTNSIYTITVGALDRNNVHPVYSESCAAVMIVMYSSSGQHADAIYTTDWSASSPSFGCTDTHGGTSAAAPLASGVYALVLEVRPDLTWRDMQHLTVQNAVPIALDDPGWEKTAVGRRYNNKFGYGKLDAYTLVEAARTFVSVRPQTHFLVQPAIVRKPIPQDERLTSVLKVTAEDVMKANMSKIEHVTVVVNIDHQRRGDVEMWLTSPAGVVSQLATHRPSDANTEGYRNWTMMTVKHWGEDPVGDWTFQITDSLHPSATGTLNYWWLTIWGETAPPTVVRPSLPPIISSPPPPSSASSPTSSAQHAPTDSPEGDDNLLPSGTKTRTLLRPTVTATATSESDGSGALPVSNAGSGPGGAAAIAFGAAVLGAAGGGVWFIRRWRNNNPATAGAAGVSGEDYEFEMLNDDEVDAAFEDEDDDNGGDSRGSRAREDDTRGPIPDRFVLSNVDEDTGEYHDDPDDRI